MVTSEKEIVLWRRQFQTEKIQGDLGPVIASVNVITKEEDLVGCLFRSALELAQHSDQVIKLAVDIANDNDFAINAQKIGLGSKRLLYPAENLLHAILADLTTFEEIVFY